jgi:hypothetical protein
MCINVRNDSFLPYAARFSVSLHPSGRMGCCHVKSDSAVTDEFASQKQSQEYLLYM